MYFYSLEQGEYEGYERCILANNAYFTQSEFEKICIKCMDDKFVDNIWLLANNLIRKHKFFFPEISARIDTAWWNQFLITSNDVFM